MERGLGRGRPAAARAEVFKFLSPGRRLEPLAGQTPASFAFGQYVYRSKDGGASWDNLTAVKVPGGLASLVGLGLKDLAISPKDEDEVVVAGDGWSIPYTGRR